MADLLKFITCGSVDDGKSTLIGHMLYDAKLLFADQEQALELDSKVTGHGNELDYSLLLDGLAAEREQGITIDVAYRYFTTEKRSFIVADTPGHEEYTRNMAVGASFADLAVILVDGSHGILSQTRRHARICALMGIEYFCFTVNKMDLLQYRQEEYIIIEREIRKLAIDLDLKNITIIPVSATKGDNITRSSERMPWYRGKTLLDYLETIDIPKPAAPDGLILPIQRVCRPNSNFRGYQGQIEEGTVSVNDELTVLPSREKAKVKELLTAGKVSSAAQSGDPVTIVLDRDVDVSRGCVFVRNRKLYVGSMFDAKILWMDDEFLPQGKNFLLKIGTRMIPAAVMQIKNRIDVNTGEQMAASKLYKNEIAECIITTSQPVVFDRFTRCHSIGSFILIDRMTDQTSACGIIAEPVSHADNLTWQKTDITRELRADRLGQRPVTIWFTGLSGSGKSSTANALERLLFQEGRSTMLLDGDNVRMGLNKNLGFEPADRIENIRRVAEVAKLMNDAGLIVLTAFISPFADDRLNARHIIGGDRFIEIYMNTPLEVCEKRDVKGLYAKARENRIKEFTGISSPYEIPFSPDISLSTENQTPEECAELIMAFIRTKVAKQE